MKIVAIIYGVVLGEMICLMLNPHHWIAFVIWGAVGGGTFWFRIALSRNCSSKT